MLNDVSRVTEADIPVTSVSPSHLSCNDCTQLIMRKGVVHIIDRVLDPSAQIFEKDLPKVPEQAFIPGSCADQSLPYC